MKTNLRQWTHNNRSPVDNNRNTSRYNNARLIIKKSVSIDATIIIYWCTEISNDTGRRETYTASRTERLLSSREEGPSLVIVHEMMSKRQSREASARSAATPRQVCSVGYYGELWGLQQTLLFREPTLTHPSVNKTNRYFVELYYLYRLCKRQCLDSK